ncbi:MAG: SulP family inorganic anion transporter [Opitutaceae bacterium]
MSWDFPFRPKLWDSLRGYNRRMFQADLTAGLTVGVVALPLAMAFGIASGVTPEAGIYTAIIAGFLISFFGGSRLQIGGPTGAFVVIVYGIITQYGLPNLLICTMMAGVILVIMGACRMGSIIKFIPYPVTMGFTNGIAVLILSTQIKDFLGLQIESLPGEFIPRMASLGRHLDSINWLTTAVAVSGVVLIKLWPRSWGRRLPGSFAVLVLGTAAVALFNLPLETIGTRFGGIPASLPAFAFPEVEWSQMRDLVRPATVIALLAAIESLLSAVVADGMSEDHHDSNQELIAQGIANFCTPLFGGIPATGAIARTATNIRNGAVSPISGMIHALTLLGIILIAAPVAKDIPLAVLSSVLVVVAVNMGEWREFRRLFHYPKSDGAVFVTTFGLTVVFDLTLAIEVGMILAAILFIKRISETTEIEAVSEHTETEGALHSIVGRDVPPGVQVYRVHGALFFGAARKLEAALERGGQQPRVLILRMRTVLTLDSTAINAIEGLIIRLKRKHVVLVLSGTPPGPTEMMRRSGLLDQIGLENVVPNIEAALDRAREILGASASSRPA